MASLHSVPLRSGSQGEENMNRLSIRGEDFHKIFPLRCTTHSHLKVLVPTFCKSVDLLLGKLAPLADGETKVSLKTYIRNNALDIISKVISHCCRGVGIRPAIAVGGGGIRPAIAVGGWG